MRRPGFGNRCILEGPVVFGCGGTCKTMEAFHQLIKLEQTQVVEWGSALVEKRDGNPGTVLWINNGSSLNRMGLPESFGLEWYEQNLPLLVQQAKDRGKTFLFNIAPLKLSHCTSLSAVAEKSGVPIIVVDLSCSNAGQDASCFSAELVDEAIAAVQEAAPSALVVPKIAHIPTNSLLHELATIFVQREVAAVAAINTIPFCYGLDQTGNPLTDGLAGGGGMLARHAAMGMVQRLDQLLPSEMGIVAMGGVGCAPNISAAEDVLTFVGLGASAVAFNTFAHDPNSPYALRPHVYDEVILEVKALQRQTA